MLRSALEYKSKRNSTHLLSSSEDSRYAIRSPSWSSKWMCNPPPPPQLVCIPYLHTSTPSFLVYFIFLLSISLYFQSLVICVRPSMNDYVTHPYNTVIPCQNCTHYTLRKLFIQFFYGKFPTVVNT
jgi:hypothetical protein